jgi:hypothetical protein
MNKTSTILACAVLWASMAAHAVDRDASTFVFVGQLVDFEELPDQCPPSKEVEELDPTEDDAKLDSICIQFDALFRATYRVLEILHGDIESQTVTFHIADHYGFPAFAYFKNALLFLEVHPDEIWLEKYQGYALHRTKDESWATCGNPYDEWRGNPLRYLIEPKFQNPLGSVGEFSKIGARRIFGDSPHIIIDGSEARCVAGVRLIDLYEMVRTGVLKARGINLPMLRDQEDEL